MSPLVIDWALTKVDSDSPNDNPLSLWNFFGVKGHDEIISIGVCTLIIFIMAVIYFFSQKKYSPNVAPTGYVLVVELYVKIIRNIVVNALGRKNEKLTPLFLVLSSYIFIANILGIFGFYPPTGSLTVTLSLGLFMFTGVICFAFKYQRLSFLKGMFFTVKLKRKDKLVSIPVMINPTKIIGEVTPLLSISLRLWGNIFAGEIIVTLFYFLFTLMFSSVSPTILGVLCSSIFAGIFAPVFHLYFDLTVGFIQTIVFTMLTITYWNLKIGNEIISNEEFNNNDLGDNDDLSFQYVESSLMGHDKIG